MSKENINIDIDEEKDTIRNVLGCNANEDNLNDFDNNYKEKSFINFSFKKREEDIKKSLEPTKEYEKMNGTKNNFSEIKETIHKKNENKKLNIILLLLIILSLITCCFFFTFENFIPKGRSLTKSETINIDTNENFVNIDGVIISFNQSGNLFEISIDNNHYQNGKVLYNVNGTYLTSNDKAFCTYIEQNTNLTPYFFNKPINYGNSVIDTIYFNSSSVQKSECLMLTDVLIDNYSYDIVFKIK